MKLLSDETYASKDGLETSRNIWYGSADITAEGEYGTVLALKDSLMDELCGKIMDDLNSNPNAPPTETNWYFYGHGITKETIGKEAILPAIMVRNKKGKFVANISVCDYDFCVSIDAIIPFKANLESRLNMG